MVTTEAGKSEPRAVQKISTAEVAVGGDSPFGPAAPFLVALDPTEWTVVPAEHPTAFGGTALDLLSGIADKSVDRAKKIGRSCDAWVQAGLAATAAGKFESAAEAFREALALDPNSRSAKIGLARLQHESGNAKAAVETLTALLREAPQDVEVRTNLAVAVISSGKPQEALKTLAVDVEPGPSTAALFAVRGGVKLRLGEYADAIGDLRKAVRLKPEWVHARNILGIAELKAGHQRAAEKHFREASRVGPMYAEGSLNLLRLLKIEERWEELVRIADSLWTSKTAPVEIAILAGNASLNIDDNRGARRWFDGARDKARTPIERSDIFNNLGVALHRLDKPEEAGEAFEQAAKANPNELAVTNRAKAYLQEGKYSAALEWLIGWRDRIDLETPECLRTFASCLFHTGQYREAAAVLESRAGRSEPSADTQSLLSMIYSDGLQDFEAAVRAGREGLAIDPQNPGLLNNLAYALLEADRADEAALVLRDVDEARASKLSKVCLDATRGLLALHRGDLPRGLNGYEQALSLAPFESLRVRVKAKRDLEAARAMQRLGYPTQQVRQRLLRAAASGKYAEPYNLHAKHELKLLPEPGK